MSTSKTGHMNFQVLPVFVIWIFIYQIEKSYGYFYVSISWPKRTKMCKKRHRPLNPFPLGTFLCSKTVDFSHLRLLNLSFLFGLTKNLFWETNKKNGILKTIICAVHSITVLLVRLDKLISIETFKSCFKSVFPSMSCMLWAFTLLRSHTIRPNFKLKSTDKIWLKKITWNKRVGDTFGTERK